MQLCGCTGLPENSPRPSGADALILLEVTHACVSCQTADEFRGILRKLQELVPFDNAFAAAGYHDPRGGAVLTRHINDSFPDTFLNEFASRKYLELDPLFRTAFTSDKSVYVSPETVKRPKGVVELCHDYGLTEGYFCCSKPNGATDDGCLFTIKRRSWRYDVREASVLNFVMPHLQLAFSRIGDDRCADVGSVSLSDREKEVLQWLKEGKTSWEISMILCISERTVNFHVYNTIRKLGATNRPQAVAVATRYGLIG